MKSRINRIVDYHDAAFRREVDISCPAEHIERKMKNIARAHKKTGKVQTVEEKDVAVLTLESAMERYDRKHVPVTVGAGLYSKTLERQLVGKKVGEPFAAEVDGHEVRVVIEDVSRTIFPEPTDAMVREAGLEDIETVEQYRRSIIEEYEAERRNAAVYEIMDEVLEYVLTHSDWEFDEDEIDEVYQMILEDVEAEVRENLGKGFAEASDEELRGYTGCDTKEEFLRELRSQSEREIAMSLFLLVNHGIDAKTANPEEAHALDWDFLTDYIGQEIHFINGSQMEKEERK